VTTIRGTTRLAAVLGWPIRHSRSPELLGAAFAAAGLDAVMVPLAVPPADLPTVVAALRAVGALGASVTAPHKQAVVACCDELGPAARTIGAVNCLAFADGRVIGHNTDGDGFADALAAAGVSLRGKRTVLLGAGGAARAVAYGVREGRAIEVIARRPAEVGWALAWPWQAEHLRDAFARADLVVDCTSTALDEAAEGPFVDGLPLDALRPHAVVASLAYHHPPRLLAHARALGHVALDGRAMLVHQGARAFTWWTDQPAPIAAMTAGLARALAG
jgi:shikimate dehydrogenase